MGEKIEMSPGRAWTTYPATYRAKELKILAAWISAGESGSVVGLSGSGRANLLGFLGHRPEVVEAYLRPQAGAVALIPLDLNNLPAPNLSTLYRVIIRAFYRVQDRFEPALQQKITAIYQESRAEQDPFLAQGALQELLLLFQARQIRVVLVLNRFDHFCQQATPPMVNTLRGLRDDFKDTLCYLAGMTHEVAYLPDPSVLGDMDELLDNYVCWVGAMSSQDARHLLLSATRTAPAPPTEEDVTVLLALTGGYPALLRTACDWWLTTENKGGHAGWAQALLAERSMRHRLAKIWHGLTQEEQFTLSELQKLQTAIRGEEAAGGQTDPGKARSAGPTSLAFFKMHQVILNQLTAKGVCCRTETGWRIAADLLAAYVAQVEGRGRGRIWQDDKTGEIYQGQTLLQNLTALERSVLTFLIRHPRLSHTKTDLIFNTWPDELRQQGVSDNSLYQLISTLRKAIEPDPSQPAYLVTWRGKPEGGYQFFPEGRPQVG